MIVKLGLDVCDRVRLAVAVLLCRIFRIRIAALNHEFLNDPMENRAVVKTLSRSFLKFSIVFWCRIGPKLHDHIAFAGLDYCDFVDEFMGASFCFFSSAAKTAATLNSVANRIDNFMLTSGIKMTNDK